MCFYFVGLDEPSNSNENLVMEESWKHNRQPRSLVRFHSHHYHGNLSYHLSTGISRTHVLSSAHWNILPEQVYKAPNLQRIQT